MIKTFQIILNKFLTLVCKIFHKNGSVFPGSITYNINQSILEKIKYPKYVIGVTGSSGKGTTTKLIYHILKEAGYDVVYNSSESNGIRAITTLILNNCTITGKFKHEVLLLELDEKHLHLAFRKNKMTHLVLTNITRDQPTRNCYPDLVIKSIMDALDNNTTIIINADDPLLKSQTLTHQNKFITYGVGKYENSFLNPGYSTDNAYCPKCHHKLIYSYYQYGHLGNYHCPNCDFQRNPINYEATNVSLEKQTMLIDNEQVNLEDKFIYLAYANIAAYSLAKTLNIPKKTIIKALNTNYKDENINTREYNLTIDNRPLTMLISKNENSLSYYQSLQYIKNDPKDKCIIIGFENVSRRYKLNDMSWLWDIDFELLNEKNVKQIVIIGRFKYNIALRLMYANISPKKFIYIDDPKDIVNILKNYTTGNIYSLIGFELTKIILHQLEEEKERGEL